MEKINIWARLSLYFLAAVFVSVGIGLGFTDDGLRHLAFAANSDVMHNWGEIFPNSLFGLYDPWNFWHYILSAVIDFSTIKSAHIVVNFFSLFILMILMDQIFHIELKRFKNVIPIFVILSLGLVSSRYTNLRPDLLSGFYVMLVYISFHKFKNYKRVFVIFLLTILYVPMYYLFFIYSGMFVMFSFLVKDYKTIVSLILASIIGLFYYHFMFGEEAFNTIINVLKDEELRDGILIGEGMPLFDILNAISYKALFELYLLVIVVLREKFKETFSKVSLLTLLLSSSLLWVGQMRYYALFLPIFYIIIILIAVNIHSSQIKKIFLYLREQHIFLLKKFYSNNKNISFIFIFILFVIFEMGVYFKTSYNDINVQSEQALKIFKSSKFDNSKILFNTLDKYTYFSLYSNPTIKEIPSCSVGEFKGTREEHRLYKKMIKRDITEEELILFAKKMHPDFIVLKLPINNKSKTNIDKLTNNGFKLLIFFGKNILFSYKNID